MCFVNFEWDENKRRSNLLKHDVDFADAVGVLLDPFNRTIEDPEAAREHRYITLGRGYCDRILLVVWTEREDDVLRIISARKASYGERQMYGA